MNSQEILSQKKEILTNLSKRQIKQAIALLTNLSVNLQSWNISEKLSELDTNYKFMLHYQFEANEDPTQKEVYYSIIRTLYEITDNITDELLMTSSSAFFYEKARMNSINRNISISSYLRQLKEISESMALVDLLENGGQKEIQLKDLSIKRERIATEMFLAIYTSPQAEEKDFNDYMNFLQSFDIKEREKCLFISAITLNLIHRFDAKKVRIIMNLSTDESPMISQRAIVGLIIILQMYDTRWRFYPECQQQLEALSENLYFKQSVITIIKQLIRSRETEKISKILTEEIIPEMLKFNSLAGKKLNMEDLMGDSDFSEKNPEWKKELEESGLANKLQEYSNLQMEGADVFHSTFSNLKSFPFFRDISNWFLPFDKSYSELQGLFSMAEKDSLLQAAIVNSGHMCDSDKYSFCFSLLQLPESQRQMMLHRFSDESEEMKQIQKEAARFNSSVKDENISNQYIQDLYRFFKLFTYKNNFFDIFRLQINFFDKKAIAPLLSDSKDMKQIALYYFEKNFFKEAANVYHLLINKGEEDSDMWQKIGYCKQMLNEPQEALESYLQADLLQPDNTWTIKRIAQLYRSLKNPELALEYHIRLQTLNSGNIANELNIGHCYLDMGEYDKALNAYFKVELFDGGDNPKAWRPIAWTSFLLKKFDLSQKYYQKILVGKPTEHDFMNAGHVELALNNKKEALKYYMKTVSILNNNPEEFISLFESDKDTLINLGINESFFVLLFDELRYRFD